MIRGTFGYISDGIYRLICRAGDSSHVLHATDGWSSRRGASGGSAALRLRETPNNFPPLNKRMLPGTRWKIYFCRHARYVSRFYYTRRSALPTQRCHVWRKPWKGAWNNRASNRSVCDNGFLSFHVSLETPRWVRQPVQCTGWREKFVCDHGWILHLSFDVKNQPQNWISRSNFFFALCSTRHEGKTVPRNRKLRPNSFSSWKMAKNFVIIQCCERVLTATLCFWTSVLRNVYIFE